MDTYLEYIVKPKYSIKAALTVTGLYLLATLFSIVIFMLSLVYPLVMQFSFALTVGLFVGAWMLAQKFNIEYEYIVTNDELDVDKIMSKKTRKRMLTVSCKKFEIFGKAEGIEFERALSDRSIEIKFDASIGKNSFNRYFAVFDNKQGQKMLLIFNPTRSMLEAFRKHNPLGVIIDD